MKQLLLLPVLLGSASIALAQAPSCTALQTENVALKDTLVAYEARLGIGVGGVTVEEGPACSTSPSTARCGGCSTPSPLRGVRWARTCSEELAALPC